MSRRKKNKNRCSGPNKKLICSMVLILFGIVLIIWWMPIWIWFVIIGFVFIVVGINIFK